MENAIMTVAAAKAAPALGPAPASPEADTNANAEAPIAHDGQDPSSFSQWLSQGLASALIPPADVPVAGKLPVSIPATENHSPKPELPAPEAAAANADDVPNAIAALFIAGLADKNPESKSIPASRLSDAAQGKPPVSTTARMSTPAASPEPVRAQPAIENRSQPNPKQILPESLPDGREVLLADLNQSRGGQDASGHSQPFAGRAPATRPELPSAPASPVTRIPVLPAAGAKISLGASAALPTGPEASASATYGPAAGETLSRRLAEPASKTWAGAAKPEPGKESTLASEAAAKPEPPEAGSWSLPATSNRARAGTETLALEPEKSVSSPPRSETLKAFVQGFTQGLQAGQDRISIELEPPTLGHVRVEIHQVEGRIDASLTLQNQSVGEFFQTQVEQLRQSLQEAGVRLGQLTVDVDQQPNSGTRESLPRAGGKSGRTAGSASAASRAVAAARKPGWDQPGRVDMLV